MRLRNANESYGLVTKPAQVIRLAVRGSHVPVATQAH
jgi:hypothetical protein